jgi:AcrR family transcriptional regulator
VPRAKQRTPELRDHVLDVAVAMLASQGVSGFTTREVAQRASTSTPAVYELFGDKAGLVREVFFEGFRLLRRHFGRLAESADPRADLVGVVEAFREFVGENPMLAEVMFSRPFADFDPGPEELRAGSAVREFIVGCVRRCTEAGILGGNETDIAHVLMALAQGLAAQETAGWLGTSKASMNRRWDLAIRAVLDGLSPTNPRPADRPAT